MYNLLKNPSAFKVDGLISLHVVDIFSEYGWNDSAFILNVGSLTTDDFAFNYGLLNTLGYRLRSRQEFIHTLMHLSKTTNMALTQLVKNQVMIQSQKDDAGDLYG